ncbi:histidyl-tRNA synthetase [Pseudarcicella hirudinis]|uniref:Histidine--tRNA ligase n=1 Tax=Pseudarcicella hirudinis TaxID=1079859 RepID=A0A1I5W948_9BACT|nr:histidine--tRNA ligase [Pseudarcicella hirudinis]SFQ16127.1 histidyl-tRNA synthetase [Pseudarcicella hirudinis]
MSKPSLVKGTRDFGPDKMVKRNFIFDTIKQTFQRFGFMPLETPTMENLSVLMGKYGDEGDQLLFKVLNSGNFSEKISQHDLDEGYKKLTSKISEKGLRYDLTVPFARYVTMNRGELTFPFKRYQIQPVWRADRPQKGRYREFYQCDADVVGTDSLICEAEIVLMIHEVFKNLGIDFTLKINNRKILTGLSEMIGQAGQEGTLAVAIDKLDKIGKEKVLEELTERGFSQESILKLDPVFEIAGSNAEKFEKLSVLLQDSETGKKGIEELQKVWSVFNAFDLSEEHVELDITLARGLSYYTGAIFEVKANGVQIGSITGGGRYDNLTGTFGMPGVSGVGISFGVDRIYDVLEELNLFPENQSVITKLLFCYFDEQAQEYALPLLGKARKAGINAEIYPETAKFKKQLDYADRKQIPFVCIIGSEEIETGQLTFKNMISGEQKKLSFEEILQELQAVL